MGRTNYQGYAEEAQCEALASLHAARPALRHLLLAGHPGALGAYRDNRRAERYIVRANACLNPITKRTA